MSEWIVHRRPTKEDANENGHVLHSDSEGVFLFTWINLTDGDPWMPVPSPYKPPEPDTSLSASIERVQKFFSDLNFDYSCFDADIDRIIEAARKWDESQRNGVTSQAFCRESNDPDGVGEGWELVKNISSMARPENDAMYQYKQKNGYVYRRRIDADCVTHQEGYGNVCERGTPNCPGGHDDIGESEAGRRYQERTEASVGRQRREWWICVTESKSDLALRHDDPDYDAIGMPLIHVREVLPGDPDQEWVGELVAICEKSGRYAPDRIVHQIKKHLKKRGEK